MLDYLDNRDLRWSYPGTASFTAADKAIEEYNASNGKVLKEMLSGGTDNMLDLIAAHLQVSHPKVHAAYCSYPNQRLCGFRC